MTVDSLAVATLLESLRAVAPDTLVVSVVDTVFAQYPAYETPSRAWNVVTLALPSILVVLGWWFARRSTLNLQRRRLYDEVRYESWLRAAAAIEKHIEWLEEWEKMHIWSAMQAKHEDIAAYEKAEREKAPREHKPSKRPDIMAPSMQAIDRFFPGIGPDFEVIRSKESLIFIGTESMLIDAADDKEALLKAATKAAAILKDHRKGVLKTYEDWRDRVHDDIFDELIRQQKRLRGSGGKQRRKESRYESKSSTASTPQGG